MTSPSKRDRLYRRRIDELGAVPVRGTEGSPTTPFFSPDGESIGYWDQAARELRRISAAGGTPLVLTPVGALYGAAWQRDETVLYAQEDGIWRVPVTGGAPEQLVRIEPAELAYGPQALDGTRILFTVVRRAEMSGRTGWDNARVMVQSIGSSDRREIIRGSDARVVRSGHLVYALGSVLFAIPFDTARADVRGGPVPVVEDISRAVRGSRGQGGAAQFDVSQAGTLVYVPGTLFPYGLPRRLVAVDLTGTPTALIDEERDYWRPRVSPDGTKVAVEVLGPDETVRIWIVDLERRTSSPLTLEGENAYVVWAPDGASVIYRSIRAGTVGLFRQAADGSGEARLISPQFETVRASDVSEDGVVAFMTGSPQDDIRTLDLGSAAISEFLATPAREQMAAFSPDGKWLAYTSNESGRDEVYVRPFPRSAATPRLVSVDGGTAPVWSPDGSTLYYCSAAGEIMAVPTTLGSVLASGRPRPLFRWAGIFRMSGTAVAYDMHPDGKRFIMVSEPDTPAAPPPSQVNVVLNWSEELERLMPVR